MKCSIFLLFICAALSAAAQSQTTFSNVDKFKLEGYTVNVLFKDPLKQLLAAYPDFDNKDNKTKNELLSSRLHNDTLYVFQLIKKGDLKKSYALIGNPEKLRTRTYFNLHILAPNGETEKNIDKINVGGTFFEHMSLFQTERGKEVIGKMIQIWGYFSKIESYDQLKSSIVELVKMDLDNRIPADLLYKKGEAIEPLFNYQKYALAHVKKRQITTTVFQYDSLGQVKNKYPRTETDTELYLSSISMEIMAVTTFPFFSAKDSIVKDGNLVHVNSTLENIKHYFKDIEVSVNPTSGQVVRIRGKLIIHGYSAKGHSTSDELYLAEFSPVGECMLPTKVKFTSLEDKRFATPRLVAEIEYELK